MATRTPRITLTVKLTPGKDDDLIGWLAALPKGERQGLVKRLLRGAIQRQNHAEQRLAQLEADTAWIRAALTELPTWLESLLARVVVMETAETTTPDVKAARTGPLSTEGVVRRERRIAKATW